MPPYWIFWHSSVTNEDFTRYGTRAVLFFALKQDRTLLWWITRFIFIVAPFNWIREDINTGRGLQNVGNVNPSQIDHVTRHGACIVSIVLSKWPMQTTWLKKQIKHSILGSKGYMIRSQWPIFKDTHFNFTLVDHGKEYTYSGRG